MTTRNPYFSKLPTTSKAKPTQSQSPLHKKQYYKFFAENSNRQTDQTFHAQRVVEQIVPEPPVENKEDFKKEIERRFQRSTINPTFRLPKYENDVDDDDDDISDSLSENSIESLERLSHLTKYDLHSQNLRHYASSQANLAVSDYRKASAEKIRKIAQQSRVNTLNNENNEKPEHYRPYSTYDHRKVENNYSMNTKSDVEVASVMVKKTADKAKGDLNYEYSTATSRETPMTNDTAFSTLNKATPNGLFNYSQFEFNQISLNGNTGNQFTPTYNARTAATKNRLVSDLRQYTPKETKIVNQTLSTRNITSTGRLGGAVGNRGTQVSFYPSKNSTSTASASARIAFKKTAAAGFRSSNNQYGIQNNTEIN